MTDELSVVNFTNIDNQDYDGMWGGEITVIKSGQTKQFPKFLAEHYCKHLTNKMLIKGGQDWSNEILRKPLEERIMGAVEVKTESVEAIKEVKEETFVEMPKEEVKPEAKVEIPKKKMGRPKKVKVE